MKNLIKISIYAGILAAFGASSAYSSGDQEQEKEHKHKHTDEVPGQLSAKHLGWKLGEGRKAERKEFRAEFKAKLEACLSAAGISKPATGAGHPKFTEQQRTSIHSCRKEVRAEMKAARHAQKKVPPVTSNNIVVGDHTGAGAVVVAPSVTIIPKPVVADPIVVQADTAADVAADEARLAADRAKANAEAIAAANALHAAEKAAADKAAAAAKAAADAAAAKTAGAAQSAL